MSVKAVRWKGWGLWREGFKEKVKEKEQECKNDSHQLRFYIRSQLLLHIWVTMYYCKTLIFCCILISRFWSLENLRHFNFSFLLLPSSPLNLLLSALFWCGFDSPTDTPAQPHCLQMQHLHAFQYFFFHYRSGRPKTIFFSTSENCLHLQWGFWYFMQMRFWWWA